MQNTNKTILSCLLALYLTVALSCKGETSTAPALESEIISETSEKTASFMETELPPKPDTVYVCKSPSAHKYHYDSGCRGLKRCKHTIVQMSVKDAEGKGLELCGYEEN